jgi:hypothetical protein
LGENPLEIYFTPDLAQRQYTKAPTYALVPLNGLKTVFASRNKYFPGKKRCAVRSRQKELFFIYIFGGFRKPPKIWAFSPYPELKLPEQPIPIKKSAPPLSRER